MCVRLILFIHSFVAFIKFLFVYLCCVHGLLLLLLLNFAYSFARLVFLIFRTRFLLCNVALIWLSLLCFVFISASVVEICVIAFLFLLLLLNFIIITFGFFFFESRNKKRKHLDVVITNF